MKCEYCQEHLPDDSIFCSNCGQPVKAQAVEPSSFPQNPAAQPSENHTNQQQGNDSDPQAEAEPFAPQSQPSQAPPTPQQSPSPQVPPAPQQSQPPQGEIPAGYTYDPKSGQYYTSRTVIDPYTNRQVNQVTYYNPQTRLYNTTNYPIGYSQSQQNVPPRNNNSTAIIIVVGIIVAIIVFVLVLTASISDIMTTAFDRMDNWSDPYGGYSYGSDYSSGYDSEYDSYDDYTANRIYDPSSSEIKPFFSEANSAANPSFPHGSYFSSTAVESGDYVYFLSENYTLDSRYLVRFNTKTKESETVLDVGLLNCIDSFAIWGDKVVFSVCESYSSDYDTNYFLADLSTFEYKFLFKEISSTIVIEKGYIYLVDDITKHIIKIGLNASNETTIGAYSLDLDYYTYAGSSPFSISDNYLYLYCYNDSDADFVYKYNLDTMVSVLIFQGQPGFYHENYFIDGDRIFYSRYDIRENENYDVIVASSKLGQLNSEEIYYIYENETIWTDQDIFIGKSSDSFFYSDDNSLNKTSLSDPKTVVESVELSKFPDAISENWIIVGDSIVSTKDLSQIPLTPNYSNPKIIVTKTS